jgi:DNA-binding NtrC family response regulator
MASPTKSEGIKLLLVDDEVDFLKSLSERLSNRGFDVVTATDGEQALEAAKKGSFDIAIVDLKMPGMDGTEVLKLLKEKHKWLEVIMLTAYGTIDSAIEAAKLGAHGYLEKPYDFDKLVAAIKDAYTARLLKKHEKDKKRQQDIEFLSMGSPLSILASLRRLHEDEEK